MVLTASTVVVPVEHENIPDALRQAERWCVWKRQWDGEEFSKPPYQAGNPKYKLSKTNPSQWRPFATAVQAYEQHEDIDGLGFVTGGGFIAIDYDECVDEVTREVRPDVLEEVMRFNSYAEFSPSGRGIRVILRGSLPGKNLSGRTYFPEIYGDGGYVTVTGAMVPGLPAEVAEGGELLAELYAAANKKKAANGTKKASLPEMAATASPVTADQSAGRPVTPPAGGLSDDEVQSLISRSKNAADINTLMEGGLLSHHPSASEGDQALANHLAFFCGPHGHQQIERLMRGSERMRDKFDVHPDYLKDTIAKAIAGASAFYEPGYRSDGKTSKKATGERSGAKAREKKHAPELPNGIPSTGPANLNDTSTLTDIGLARRLVLEARGTLRYCREQRNWLFFNGKRYEADDGLAAAHTAKRVGDTLWREWAELPQRAKDETFKFVKAASSSYAVEAAVRLARSEPGVVVTVAELDTNPYLLNVKNGTLDLLTLTLRPHSPADLLTHLAGVEFDQTANAPTWKKFVDDVAGGDKELVAFLQRSCGLALSGNVSDHVLWLHYGEGRNGKSTMLGVLGELLGSYSGPAPLSMLLVKDKASKEVETQFASLAGKRLVTAVEADSGVRFSEASMKLLTGGDTVQARRLYENPWSLKPTWKIHIAANAKPAVRGRDEGVWQRIMLTPWLQRFDGQRQDKKLKDKLLAELPGILNWCVAGFARWQAEGLNPPKCVLAATTAYRSENDILGTWLSESCLTEPHAVAEFGRLYSSFAAWCSGRGEHCGTSMQFGKELDRLGYAGDRPNSGPWRNKTIRHGIGLLDERRGGEL